MGYDVLEILKKIDNNEKLTEEELKYLVYNYEYKSSKGRKSRYLSETTTIVKIEDRYFSIDWDEGLTEEQEDEFFFQPVEVFPNETTKVVNEIEWITKEDMDKQNVSIVDKDSLAPFVRTQLYQFKMYAKQIKSAEDKLTEQILAYMKENKIKKFENDDMTISYVESSDTERFDSAKFKEDYAKLYKEYSTPSTRKEHITIKIKEHKGDK